MTFSEYMHKTNDLYTMIIADRTECTYNWERSLTSVIILKQLYEEEQTQLKGPMLCKCMLTCVDL